MFVLSPLAFRALAESAALAFLWVLFVAVFAVAEDVGVVCTNRDVLPFAPVACSDRFAHFVLSQKGMSSTSSSKSHWESSGAFPDSSAFIARCIFTASLKDSLIP